MLVYFLMARLWLYDLAQSKDHSVVLSVPQSSWESNHNSEDCTCSLAPGTENFSWHASIVIVAGVQVSPTPWPTSSFPTHLCSWTLPLYFIYLSCYIRCAVIYSWNNTVNIALYTEHIQKWLFLFLISLKFIKRKLCIISIENDDTFLC